jgi:hypothetical protein
MPCARPCLPFTYAAARPARGAADAAAPRPRPGAARAAARPSARAPCEHAAHAPSKTTCMQRHPLPRLSVPLSAAPCPSPPRAAVTPPTPCRRAGAAVASGGPAPHHPPQPLHPSSGFTAPALALEAAPRGRPPQAAAPGPAGARARGAPFHPLQNCRGRPAPPPRRALPPCAAPRLLAAARRGAGPRPGPPAPRQFVAVVPFLRPCTLCVPPTPTPSDLQPASQQGPHTHAPLHRRWPPAQLAKCAHSLKPARQRTPSPCKENLHSLLWAGLSGRGAPTRPSARRLVTLLHASHRASVDRCVRTAPRAYYSPRAAALTGGLLFSQSSGAYRRPRARRLAGPAAPALGL